MDKIFLFIFLAVMIGIRIWVVVKRSKALSRWQDDVIKRSKERISQDQEQSKEDQTNDNLE